MKRVLLALICGLASACGGGEDSPTAPTSTRSSVLFTLDANSCRGVPAVTIEFFVDGSTVGSGTLSPGQTSQSFPVSAGSHLLSARVANFDIVWPSLNATTPAGGSFTYLLIC